MEAVKEEYTAEPGMEIRAAAIGPEGGCLPLLTEEAIAAVLDPKRVTWMHILAHDRQAARELLENRLRFHELTVEDSLNEEERPTLHEHDNYLFLVAPSVVRTPEGEHFVEIGVFLTDNSLVTVATEPAPVVDAWFARWCRRPSRAGGTAGVLLHSLLDAIVDEYFPAVDRLEDEIDELAESIFRGNGGDVREVLDLKTRLLEFRRRVSPLRDVLNGLLRRDVELIEPSLAPYFQDVHAHTLRVAELVDMNRETLATVMDIHLTTVSNNLNNVMKKLTVIATALMTMALIASVYGMNFEVMPELGWAFGYPFALGLMLVAALVIVSIFRRKGWI
jgi:magnesium transporter